MSLSVDSVWNLYLATRLHFLHGYDAVKYKGKLKAQQKAAKRPDKVLARGVLTELESKREVVEFCVANFMYENDAFIYENQDDATAFFNRWKKYWASSDYMISRDVSVIETQMITNDWSYEEYMSNRALHDVMTNAISRETLCVLEHRIPKSMIFLNGFGSEKTADRIQKTLPFIEARLSKITFDPSVLESSHVG